MTTEIKSLHNYPLCDTTARESISDLSERVSNLESGTGSSVRESYQESGDLFTLLSEYEVESMKKEGYRINTNGYVEQAYTNFSIHYFDVSNLAYERLLLRCHSAVWTGAFCYYDPSNSTYTLIRAFTQGNAGGLLRLNTIPEGCYLCFSCLNTNYTTGKFSYLARIWLNPSYSVKFEGLDEGIKSIPVELADVDYSGFIYLYIDMSEYTDCVFKLILNSGPSSYAFHASDYINDSSNITASDVAFDKFTPWVYQKRYLIILFRTNDFVNIANHIDMSMGWINPEVARVQKQLGYWGTKLMAHNADTRIQLINACVWADIVDVDLCRTLDGKYVCMHGTTINGHTIPSTNLADLELTYNQMSSSDAYEIMKRYGTFCFHNFRETTAEQMAEQENRAYNIVGKHCVWGNNIVNNADHPLRGHLSKFYSTLGDGSIQQFVDWGADPSRIIGSANEADTTYNDYDINKLLSVDTLTAWDLIPKDGSCAYLWINSDPANALSAPLESE